MYILSATHLSSLLRNATNIYAQIKTILSFDLSIIFIVVIV